MSGEVRLQKFLSQAGMASRRAAEKLILEGRVRINGKLVRELGTKVDPRRDKVDVDGKAVRVAQTVWLALYKPAGYVSTRSDPEGRTTIYDLIPPQYAGLFHVGRLDVNSEGLMLLTNEGDLANRMMHPRYEVDRVYEVHVTGGFGPADAEKLRAGVMLEDGMARVHGIEFLGTPKGERTRLKVTMREGRNREVRRLFEAIGFRVVRLVRRRYGPVRLTGLAAGQFRKLTREERAALERGDSGERPARAEPRAASARSADPDASRSAAATKRAGARSAAKRATTKSASGRKQKQKPRDREGPPRRGKAVAPRKPADRGPKR